MVTPPRLLIPLLAGLCLHAPGQTPWAVEVISYHSGVNFEPGYDLPGSTLGRPTVTTYKDMAEGTPSVTVVPVYPAWDPLEIVSIGGGGHLTLRMGEAIVDDPDNPYGVDFLIFGNSLVTGAGLYNQDANTPEDYTLAGFEQININSKNGRVSVSADGVSWFYFADQPRLGMLPTLGRVWEAGQWGDVTDPTVPPDPALDVKALAGLPLTGLISRYRGGAGGTGLDLANLIVPQGMTRPGAFWYVRIEVPEGQFRTEIDAVTVVRPAGERRRWEIRHFAWMKSPAVERAAVGVRLLANGCADLLHPEAGELPGWILEWTHSLMEPDWRNAAETPLEGPLQFFRARRLEAAP